MSFFCRIYSPLIKVKNPFPDKNYRAIVDENGKSTLQECEPVAPSLASDFSVSENALMGRFGSAPFRVTEDPVDFEKHINGLL